MPQSNIMTLVRSMRPRRQANGGNTCNRWSVFVIPPPISISWKWCYFSFIINIEVNFYMFQSNSHQIGKTLITLLWVVYLPLNLFMPVHANMHRTTSVMWNQLDLKKRHELMGIYPSFVQKQSFYGLHSFQSDVLLLSCHRWSLREVCSPMFHIRLQVNKLNRSEQLVKSLTNKERKPRTQEGQLLNLRQQIRFDI